MICQYCQNVNLELDISASHISCIIFDWPVEMKAIRKLSKSCQKLIKSSGEWLFTVSSYTKGLFSHCFKMQAGVCIASYTFHPEEEGELYFKRGDRIEVLDKEGSDWWKGKNLSTGNEGWFPAKYVQK